jgi:hypothetical protein
MGSDGYDSLTDKSAPGEFCDTDAMWAATREIAEGRRHTTGSGPEIEATALRGPTAMMLGDFLRALRRRDVPALTAPH